MPSNDRRATPPRLPELGARGRNRRWLLGGALLAAAAAPTELGTIVRAVLADAYLQVSVFVAATLGIFYLLERKLDIDTAGLLARHRRWQVPIAAFFGALPGCGGAVIVVTQFVQGRTSFGALVAVLVATMGDAAFLLLSQRPLVGLSVFGVGLVVGTISGYVIDAIHGPDFLRTAEPERRPAAAAPALGTAVPASIGAAVRVRELPVSPGHRAWLLLLPVGIVLGVLGAAQVDLGAVTGSGWVPATVGAIGLAGAAGSLLVWIRRGGASLHLDTVGCDVGRGRLSPLSRMVMDTSFVTTWVILGFLVFELGVHYTGFDLAGFFATAAPAVPLLAIVVGLLPGCGPQVITTTLYLSGMIPLSAQLGNAISNDGDALFPAIALAPRAAVYATLYSTIPALLVAYSFYFLFE